MKLAPRGTLKRGIAHPERNRSHAGRNATPRSKVPALKPGTAKNDVQSFAPTAPLSLAAGRAKTSRRREEAMLRLIAVAFALALASSAQAVPIAPIQKRAAWSRQSAKHAAPVCTW